MLFNMAGGGSGGGINYELLWVNASPGSSFPEQTITVPGMAAYSAIVLVCSNGVGIMRNNGLSQSVEYGLAIEDNHQKYSRTAKPSGNTIAFRTCLYSRTGDSTYEANDSLIPYKVYGIKGWEV